MMESITTLLCELVIHNKLEINRIIIYYYKEKVNWNRFTDC